VRTFAADDSDRSPDPLPYSESSNSEIFKQAQETQRLINQIKAGQRQEDRWIAEFWSDDCPTLTFTPAARFIAVANQLVKNEKVDLALAVETYARVGMAICDAGIRCWGEKYRFNFERPIDYIRRVIGDRNWNTIMCPDGSGNYFTPNFPAYPSGHATFGAAAAEVLAALYGINYRFTDRCHEGRSEFLSAPRTFRNFYEMAEENAYSRLPIGVHFRMDAEAGVSLGYAVGRKVNALPWRK
jgi:membrane-associated phospholipid phosphatase